MHILHDNTLTADNRDKFSYIAGQYGQLVKFYNVEELCADKIAAIKNAMIESFNSRFSIAATYRLLTPQILAEDIEKIIYLDSDIIVNLDINELWQINFRTESLAAIPHKNADYMAYLIDKNRRSKNYLMTSGLVDYDDYFNSGVLLLNLKALRNDEAITMDAIKFIGKNPQLTQFDQDLLNYLYSTKYLKLPIKFNRLVRDARLKKNHRIQKKIYHFAGGVFGLDMHDPFNRLWMKYFMRTPFFDVDTMGRLYDGFKNIQVELKQSAINISAMMSGKTRAFFIPPQNLDAFKKIFSIRDNEEIIPVENQMSLQKLIDAMNTSRGKKVFFIMLPGFPFQMLIQAGFKYGRDFVNGFDFLSEAHGLPLNSYPLIKDM